MNNIKCFHLEVLYTKFPDTNNKEISSVISRWFSGAKARDGGKKERSLKKNEVQSVASEKRGQRGQLTPQI